MLHFFIFLKASLITYFWKCWIKSLNSQLKEGMHVFIFPRVWQNLLCKVEVMSRAMTKVYCFFGFANFFLLWQVLGRKSWLINWLSPEVLNWILKITGMYHEGVNDAGKKIKSEEKKVHFKLVILFFLQH